jgi:hypothetical protein
MQKTFENFKNYIKESGKKNSACQYEYKRVLQSDSFEELFLVIKENFNWCFVEKKILSSEILLQYVELVELNNVGFYIRQELQKISGNENVWLFDSTVNVMRESSTVNVMWGSSTVNVMRESSTVNVMWGSSTVNVMRGSSTVNVMWGSSTVKEMWGSSTVKEMRESSTVNVMWGSSTVNVMWGSSTVNVMRESSTVNVMWGSSKRTFFEYGHKPKLYMKKGSHEIIYLD